MPTGLFATRGQLWATAALEKPDWVRAAIAEHGRQIAVGLERALHRLRPPAGWTREGGEPWDEGLERLDPDGWPLRYVGPTDINKDGNCCPAPKTWTWP